MKPIELSIEKWDSLADSPYEYYKIKNALKQGKNIVLKDEFGIVYAFLKIDEIGKIKYIYKGFID